MVSLLETHFVIQFDTWKNTGIQGKTESVQDVLQKVFTEGVGFFAYQRNLNKFEKVSS